MRIIDLRRAEVFSAIVAYQGLSAAARSFADRPSPPDRSTQRSGHGSQMKNSTGATLTRGPDLASTIKAQRRERERQHQSQLPKHGPRSPEAKTPTSVEGRQSVPRHATQSARLCDQGQAHCGDRSEITHSQGSWIRDKRISEDRATALGQPRPAFVLSESQSQAAPNSFRGCAFNLGDATGRT